jgi:hypothetical protein
VRRKQTRISRRELRRRARWMIFNLAALAFVALITIWVLHSCGG